MHSHAAAINALVLIVKELKMKVLLCVHEDYCKYNIDLFSLLGFMTTGEESFPGNYGMQDMIHGLKWVKENIGNFRGDPDRVTIFGNSAGGGAVGLLSVSPPARGNHIKRIISKCDNGKFQY